jgi:signal transduction histidine kinase
MLARELHDAMAQSLVLLTFQVQLLRSATQKGQTEQMNRRARCVLAEPAGGFALWLRQASCFWCVRNK